MIETGAGYDDLGAVVLAQRKYAALNERAIIRSPLTLDEYHASPFVADPFRAADCTVEVDGACAILVTSVETARTLNHRPAVIQGGAYTCGAQSGLDMGDALMWEDYSRNYTSLLAEDLWHSSGVTPSEIDFAEIYDCFSSVVLIGLEGLAWPNAARRVRWCAPARLHSTDRCRSTHMGDFSVRDTSMA